MREKIGKREGKIVNDDGNNSHYGLASRPPNSNNMVTINRQSIWQILVSSLVFRVGET